MAKANKKMIKRLTSRKRNRGGTQNLTNWKNKPKVSIFAWSIKKEQKWNHKEIRDSKNGESEKTT
jgi:hypothetical protein